MDNDIDINIRARLDSESWEESVQQTSQAENTARLEQLRAMRAEILREIETLKASLPQIGDNLPSHPLIIENIPKDILDYAAPGLWDSMEEELSRTLAAGAAQLSDAMQRSGIALGKSLVDAAALRPATDAQRNAAQALEKDMQELAFLNAEIQNTEQALAAAAKNAAAALDEFSDAEQEAARERESMRSAGFSEKEITAAMGDLGRAAEQAAQALESVESAPPPSKAGGSGKGNGQEANGKDTASAMTRYRKSLQKTTRAQEQLAEETVHAATQQRQNAAHLQDIGRNAAREARGTTSDRHTRDRIEKSLQNQGKNTQKAATEAGKTAKEQEKLTKEAKKQGQKAKKQSPAEKIENLNGEISSLKAAISQCEQSMSALKTNLGGLVSVTGQVASAAASAAQTAANAVSRQQKAIERIQKQIDRINSKI